ncbi:erythrocyte membrane antigen 1 [Plasmodium vinckei brucechwatti]|uniref:Erythrocyte membrane antigen 1 n=1 Tax=Plasmodium vinckei brucechwatti TaxID=119398 RepID=A0A6V7RSQ1_PLAVN|nr:erythrocyte membrane antigen 1 [Plasmodium vinckei brucechwatti]
MKVISLSLISSIIFSIVLAKKNSGSGSTMGCFGFFRKKSKKGHKTTAEPVKEEKPFNPKLPNLKFIDEFDIITLEAPKGNQSMLDEPFISETDGIIIDEVTGFSRRKHVPDMSGWYIRPYEEDYEDMIMVNSMPLREYYQHEQQKLHNKYGVPPSVPKMHEKQGFPVEQKLSRINKKISNTLHDDDKSTVYEDDASTIRGDNDLTLILDEEIDAEFVPYVRDRENVNEDNAEE